MAAALVLLLGACTSATQGTPPPTSASPTGTGAFGSGLSGIPGLTPDGVDERAAAADSSFVRSAPLDDGEMTSYTFSADGSDRATVRIRYATASNDSADVLFVSCRDTSSSTASSVLDACLELPITGGDQAATRAWFDANRTLDPGPVRCENGLAWAVVTVNGATSVTVDVANPRNDREGTCAQVSP